MRKLVLIIFSALLVMSAVSCGGLGGVKSGIPAQVLPGINAGEAWGDVPVYPGAKESYKLGGNETSDGGVWTTIHGIYETSASVAVVSAFYKEKMPGNGWELNSWNEMENGVIADYNKNDGKSTAVVAIMKLEGSSTMITLDKKYLK